MQLKLEVIAAVPPGCTNVMSNGVTVTSILAFGDVLVMVKGTSPVLVIVCVAMASGQLETNGVCVIVAVAGLIMNIGVVLPAATLVGMTPVALKTDVFVIMFVKV